MQRQPPKHDCSCLPDPKTLADPGDHQVPSTLEGHSETITEAAAAAADKPLFLTEYAIGNHDSVTAAAGILTYVPRLSGVLPLMSYWAFSVRRSATRLASVGRAAEGLAVCLAGRL